MNYFTGLALLLLPAYSFTQPQKEKDFITTANNVVSALSKRNAAEVSKYIDPTQGVYILYRIGTRDSYQKYSTIDFRDSAYPSAPFYDNVKVSAIKYEALPKY